jgi:hypothetical protein
MKFLKIFLFLWLSVFSLKSKAQSYGQYADTINMAAYNPTRISGTNYCWAWIHLPGDSLAVTGKHPLIIFLHGAGQTGNGQAGLQTLITSQDAYMPYLINQSGTNPVDSFNFVNVVTGLTDKPFGVSPQASTSSSWSIFSYQLDSIIGDLIWHKFPGLIDTNRIYITGLSAGGEGAWDFIAHWNSVSNVVYTPRYTATAIFIQSAVINTNGQEYTNYPIPIADSVFMLGAGDTLQDLHGIQTAAVVDAFHNYSSGSAAYLSPAFLYYHGTSGGGHCCWLPQWEPTFSLSWNIRGTNYTGNAPQFLLSHSRAGLVPGEIVTVNAGSNQTLPAGTVNTLLSGSATTNKTSIVRYEWTQTGGPTTILLHPFSDTSTVVGLTNGHTYTYQLFANNQDSVSGTASMTVTVSNPTGQRIFINPYGYWYNGDTSWLRQSPISRDSVMYKLFDEQHLVDPINSPSVAPVTYPSVAVNPQEFYPLQSVVDLGTTYQLTDVYYYSEFGSDSIYFYTGSEGNWSLYYAGVTNFASWNHINSSLPSTRYFRIYLKSSQVNVGEICFYGIQQGTLLDSVPQVTHDYAMQTMNEIMGVCSDGNGFIFPALLDGLGDWIRWFQNQVWMDTNQTLHNIAQLKFNYDIFSADTSGVNVIFPLATSPVTHYHYTVNTMMQAYTNFTAQGQTLWGTTQGFPTAMTGYNGWNGFFPIDSINHPGYRDSSISGNYDRTGKFAFFYAGVGGNGGISASGQINYPSSVNQNVLHYEEINNEIDADGVTPFWTIPAAFAMFSMYYDGNGQGTVNNLGIHGADANQTVIASGTYYPDTVWYKGIKYQSYYNRTDHHKVFDAFNIHWYYFSSPNHSSGATSYALSPEQDSVRSVLTSVVKTFHTLYPLTPVYYSEWGFDRNRNSPLHVPVVSGVDSATLQAWYITRTWLAISFSGVTASTMFQFQMDPQNNPSFPHVNPYDTNALFLFNSTGLVTFFQDPTTFTIQYIAYPAYYYMRSLNNLLGNYAADSIASESPSSFWEYRYRNVNVSDSLIIAVWSPTSANTVLTNQVVSIGSPNQNVNLVQFTNGSTTGTITPAQTDNNGFLTMTISENPTFIMYQGPSPANNCHCIITNKYDKKFLINQ